MGVGKTKDDGVATVQRKPPRTPRRRTPPASTITERMPPATSKERAMHTRGPWSGGAQGVDGRYKARRSGAPGPHTHGNVGRQVVVDRSTEVRGQQKLSNDPRSNQHNPGTPMMAIRERGNNTSRSTGRSSRQNAAIGRSMLREERVTVQGPVKKQQPDVMSHRGAAENSYRRL